MTKTSFGKYFDDQRDRIVKDMQDKNKQQNVEWMERYEKRKEEYDLAILMPKDAAENVTKRRRRKGP